LAARRLAPVQCVTWGHPETTGLETMDYFLSSELMEPPDGDDHYSEKLVRLPGLSICYEPLPSAGGLLDRAALGLPDDAVVYLSCQSLFKYRPAYDDVFPRIAKRVPNARFLFLSKEGMAGDAAFRMRLRDVFAQRGLNWQDYCVLTPPVEPAAFPSLLRCADVFLDSIGWSGCNTTLEAITCGLPVVTMPAGTMRGNHSAAILMAMELRDWVAGSVEAYVGLAARLARADERTGLAGLIRARRDRLFRDMRPVRALEDFLHGAVMRAYTTGASSGRHQVEASG
jgi:protein O-GlcNAc transferase